MVTRTYTVTDACLQRQLLTLQTINVDDTTPPAITGAIPVSTVEGCAASAVPAPVTTVAALEALGLSISDICTADAHWWLQAQTLLLVLARSW